MTVSLVAVNALAFILPAVAHNPAQKQKAGVEKRAKIGSYTITYDEKDPCELSVFYFLKEQYEHCLTELEKCTKKPTGGGLYEKAECYRNLGRFEQSMRNFELAHENISGAFRPGYHFYMHMAAVAMELKNYTRALTCLEIAERNFDTVRPEPKNVEVDLLRGAILKRQGAVYERQGEFQKALQFYIRAVKIQSKKDADVLSTVPATALEKKEAEEWLKKSKSFSEADKALPRNKYRRAMSLFYQGSYGEAEDILKLLLHTNPKEAYLFNIRLARIYVLQKRYQDACVFYRKGFAFDPLRDHMLTYQGMNYDDLSELGARVVFNGHK